MVVSFPLRTDPKVKLLAWTTTPWTLPVNLALCVNAKYEYCKILDEESGDTWILLEKRLDCVYKDIKKSKFTVIERMLGSALVGIEYEPLFGYYKSRETSFRVVADNYVSDESGTG